MSSVIGKDKRRLVKRLVAASPGREPLQCTVPEWAAYRVVVDGYTLYVVNASSDLMYVTDNVRTHEDGTVLHDHRDACTVHMFSRALSKAYPPPKPGYCCAWIAKLVAK